jgi:hypothetical protein
VRDAKQIESRHEELRELRRREEPAFRDIARIIRPDDQDFEVTGHSDRDDYEVFDSTPLYAVDDYAAGMFTENTNPAERWMELTIADKDLAKWGPVQAFLWRRASRHFQSLSPAVSNFYPEAFGWFGNCGAFGNGFLYQEEWLGRQTIIDRNMPIGECFFDVDIAGNLDCFDREYLATGRQMKGFFGDKASACKDEQSYKIIHAVYGNPDRKPGRLGPEGMAYTSSYISPDAKDFRVDGGYYEMPYHPLFWAKRAGRPWASGPGHNARADMNMNNELARANQIDAQFAAEPLILTHKEGVFTSADLQPNAILEGALNADGKELLKTVQRGDNSARAEAKAAEVRAAIREAFYFSMLQVRNRPQMTAIEFMGWKEERLRQLSPYSVRIQQGLASFIARRDRILARAGQFDDDPIPPELAGHNIAVEFVSPLAKAQKLATGRSTMQWIGMLGQIAEFSQDPSVMDVVNKDGAARVLHDATVGMPDVINDQRAVAEIRAARAKAQAEKAQMEKMAQGAGIVADVAHASQAMTLSNQRGGGQ